MYFISIITSLYFIRSFKNMFSNKKEQMQNFTRFKLRQLDAKKSKKVHICGFDAEGYDNRYNSTSDLNTTQLAIFSENLKKLQLLRLLENTNVPVIRKIDLINAYFPSNYSCNLYAGNLMKDFNWDIIDTFLGFDLFDFI